MHRIAAVVCSLVLLPLSFAASRPGNFTPLGPGGGGAMFNPTISPHDPNTVLISCDMTGSYITHDGGQNWRMFSLRGVVKYFAFDPADARTMYAGNQVLWRSTDNGETWKLVYPKPSTIKGIKMSSDHSDEIVVADPDPLGTIVALAIDPNDHRILYVAAGKNRNFALFVSRDFGDSWRELNQLSEEPRRIWIDPKSPKDTRTIYVAGAHAIETRNSSGFRTFPVPFEMTDVSLGFAEDRKPTLYAVSQKGLYVSHDGGENWNESSLPGNGAKVRAVATSLHHPDVAYVSYSELMEVGTKWFGVAKTTDEGKSWKLAWKESSQGAPNIHDAWISDSLGPFWAENPLELGVAEQDPNLAYGTDFGRTMKTSDGGANWTAAYSRKVSGGEWTSTGLDVTTNYGIHFDPFDSNRRFITYTDIGLSRSEDGGKSWQRSVTGVPEEWQNTTYWVVFDPKVRGRMWSVNSGTHDLPRPKMWRHTSELTYKGGVCRSDDGGKTWTKSNDGMEETAPTHILLDPNSPPDARVLYVAAFGRGVYKTTDGGKNWALKNNGITQSMPQAWRLAMDSKGTLYVVLARHSEDGSIGNDGDGAIYRSRDGAEHWEPVALPAGVNGPNGLAIDPGNSQKVYLAAWARASGMHGDGGGIFISEDGAKTWRQVLARDRHVYDVTIDARNPKRLYASGFESSAWRSTDRGEHWDRIPGFNFKWGHRVIPDPQDANAIYVTTFGGSLWHGELNGETGPVDIATPELEPGQGD
ncbi:MAG TPA: hypothetical protein VFA85_16420 [Terriglobales bacterium]|nr:hypothetical protein [Terriglobales bacterium]